MKRVFPNAGKTPPNSPSCLLGSLQSTCPLLVPTVLLVDGRRPKTHPVQGSPPGVPITSAPRAFSSVATPSGLPLVPRRAPLHLALRTSLQGQTSLSQLWGLANVEQTFIHKFSERAAVGTVKWGATESSHGPADTHSLPVLAPHTGARPLCPGSDAGTGLSPRAARR